MHFSLWKHNAEEDRIKLIYSTPATRRVYTSVFRAPQWHGATQTQFPPRPRKSAWQCDITGVIRHTVCPHTRSNPIARYRQSSRSPATRRDAAALDDWVREPTGLLPPNQLNLEFPWPYLQRQLQLELQYQRARRIQELEYCFPLMRRPDWTTYHKVTKTFKRAERAAVAAWTQGSLRTHAAGERAMCPLCHVPVSMKHLIWECTYHEELLPPGWQRDIQANENVMMWARGLVDSPSYNPVVGPDSCEVTDNFTRLASASQFGGSAKSYGTSAKKSSANRPEVRQIGQKFGRSAKVRQIDQKFGRLAKVRVGGHHYIVGWRPCQ